MVASIYEKAMASARPNSHQPQRGHIKLLRWPQPARTLPTAAKASSSEVLSFRHTGTKGPLVREMRTDLAMALTVASSEESREATSSHAS
mmetsp:Transcript_32157/g.43542  ORF Transcript_32157/g.43542 Transcript_32157/m.43542 type:complete len:90 (-) Transcript_32157:281-550(-)